MSATVDDLSVEYEEEGVVLVKQLDKVVLTRGAWCTVMFELQNWNARKQVYDPVAYSIRRYQKRDGVYKQRSKFNISSADQATKITETLTAWLQKSTKKLDQE